MFQSNILDYETANWTDYSVQVEGKCGLSLYLVANFVQKS